MFVRILEAEYVQKGSTSLCGCRVGIFYSAYTRMYASEKVSESPSLEKATRTERSYLSRVRSRGHSSARAPPLTSKLLFISFAARDDIIQRKIVSARIDENAKRLAARPYKTFIVRLILRAQGASNK